MVEASASAPAASIRRLTGDIAEADGAQIMRIVETVDSLAVRGAADSLVAPIRHRLSEVHVPRPLRFARLLFLPLDPLIAAPLRWRSDHGTLPRPIIGPMAALVEAELGVRAAAIQKAIKDRKTDDTYVVSTLGTTLWPVAATILAKSDLPPVWEQSGLPAKAFPDLARKVATLLAEAPALDRLYNETAHGLLPPNRDAMEAIVRRVAASNPAAMAMLASLLLARMPEAVGLLYEIGAGSRGAGIRQATDQAADLLLGRLAVSGEGGSLVARGTLAEAGANVGHIVTLLDELDRGDSPPVRRGQVRELRHRLDADCRQRFTAGLREELLAPLGSLPSRPDAAAIAALEDSARSLRVLEAEARSLGGAATYDALLAQAAEAVRASPQDSGLGLADRLRLVEILAGSEAALALLRPRG